jgi:integrase
LCDLPLHKITRLDVTTRVSEINLKSGPSAAGHARLVLSALFAWAIGEGIAGENPVIGSNAPVTQARDRVLSDGELAEIWRACPDNDYGRIVKLLMLTGQRRGEIAGMRWGEVFLDECVLRLPAERVKNGLPHEIPLAPLALEIIKATPVLAARELLFGNGPNGFNGWGTPKIALDAKIQAARKKAGAKSMPPWVVHDLRRAFATGAADLGVQPHVIEAALNHVSGHKRGVAGTYNRSPYAREVRAAMALWDDHVRSIVEGAQHKIVAFPKPAYASA